MMVDLKAAQKVEKTGWSRVVLTAGKLAALRAGLKAAHLVGKKDVLMVGC
jgi:hypothetical protein